jgi:metal-dependent amidase/aminoacylase/carboxypeptidase family protein
MHRMAEGTATALGAKAVVDFRFLFAPTINDPAQAEIAATICTELVGASNVERNPSLIMASEDFSHMLERVPGCYINGQRLGRGRLRSAQPCIRL